MSSISCVVLTCFAGYLIFCHIKVSQVKNLSTPLQRACRDDQGGHIICHIWSTEEEVLDGDLSRSWEGRNPLKTWLITWMDQKVALEECRGHQKAWEQSGGPTLPGGVSWPHMSGPPAWLPYQVGPLSRGSLQPISMMHLDHSFMLVWSEGCGSSHRAI
jgi:hypothetical protein